MDLKGKRVAITGTLSRPRKEVAAWLAEQGATLTADVSSTTDLLVVGKKPGGKVARAKELGIEIVSEADLQADGGDVAASTTLPSLSTAGGPVLALPAEVVDSWEGSFEPSPGRVVEAEERWGGDYDGATDYDRALDAVSWEFGVGGLPIGEGWGIVLREGFAEVLERDGATIIHSTPAEVLDRVHAEEGEAMWEYSPHALSLPTGRLVLVDAAARAAAIPRGEGGAPDARLEVALEPGIYAVDRCCRHWPERREEVIAARLRRLGIETDLAAASRPSAVAARKTIHHACRASGVKEWWRVGSLVRDRLVVKVLKPAPKGSDAVGATRFGGRADLPSADCWPMAPGFDFVFLCQINLADLAQLDVGQRLTPEGLLSFFVGIEAVIGMHTDYAREGRVLYHPPGTQLGPFWRSWGTPRSRGMSFELVPAPPPWNSQLVGHDDPAYCELYDKLELEEDRPRTSLFGFDRVYEEALAPSEEMLLSVYCNENVDYPFVESVVLSFAIDRGALRKGDFSAVRCWEGASI